MQKNVASQKLIVFAFDSTTNLPKTGDAANITAYVSKDYGSVTVLGDTSATEMDSTNAKGYYLFDLTQGETNGNTLLFSAKSSTANIVVVGSPATVFTDPPNSSLLAIDGSGQVTVGALASGSIHLATFASDVGNLSNHSGTAQSGSTSSTFKMDTGATATDNFYQYQILQLTGGTGAGQTAIIASYVGSTRVATIVGTWAVTPDNTTTFATMLSGLALVGDKTGFALTSAYDAAKTAAQAGNAMTLTSAYDAAKTAAQAGDAMALTSGERNSTADALLDRSGAIETGITPRGALRLATAMAAGKTNGTDIAGTAHIRDVADTKNRVTATTDGLGNRTATSVDVT